MEVDTGESSRRPVTLVLASAAAVGWLIAATVWWQSSRTQSELNDSLTAAERAAFLREAERADRQVRTLCMTWPTPAAGCPRRWRSPPTAWISPPAWWWWYHLQGDHDAG